MILVASSVWIDYFRGVATPEADELDSLLGRLLEDTFADRAVRARVLEDCIRRIEEAARRRHNEILLGDLRKTEQIRSGEIPHETLTGWTPRTSSDA